MKRNDSNSTHRKPQLSNIKAEQNASEQLAHIVPPSPIDAAAAHFRTPEQTWVRMQNTIPYAYYDPPQEHEGADYAPPKHKRSRQGCLTCRARRVKCDEGHPTCDRCRKGSRSCQYPEEKEAPDSSARRKASHVKSESSSRGSSDSPQKLTLKELSREDSSGSSNQAVPKCLSPVTQGSTSPPARDVEPQPEPWPDLSHLDKNHQFYLEYFTSNISHHHFGLMSDGYGILSMCLLRKAMEHDSLLYAMLGFSSYMYTVASTHGDLHDFLPFYSKSLSLLRKALQAEAKLNVGVLLTILQLALLEEYLGDWVNLLGHQKAAYRILTALYSPESVSQDSVLTVVLEWYLRFDLTAGFISGKETTLDEKWFLAQHEAADMRKVQEPSDLRAKIAERNAYTRLLASELVATLAKKASGSISQEELNNDLDKISMRFMTWYKDVDSALFDEKKMAALPLISNSQDDRESSFRRHYDIWASRFMLLKFWGTELFLNSQIAQIRGERHDSESTSRLALRIYEMFEAIQCDDQTPGAVIGAQSAFNLACVFLGNEPSRVASCRRKLARIESSGYIYPSTIRMRLSAVWGIDVTHWWLENEEGYSPINKKIREFVTYRTRTPTDDVGQAARELRGVFEGLNLDDGPKLG